MGISAFPAFFRVLSPEIFELGVYEAAYEVGYEMGDVPGRCGRSHGTRTVSGVIPCLGANSTSLVGW